MTREQAIEEIKNYENYLNGLSKECRDYIIKALEKEPCEDAVSRKAVLEMAKSYNTNGWDMYTPLVVDAEDIEELPPVISIRPKGHWIDTHEHHYYNDGDIETTELRCSCCNETVEWDIELLHKPYYCENCGADMRGNKG